MRIPARIAAALPCALACVLALSACSGQSGSRNEIRVVGSSTVYPFSKIIAADFVRSSDDFRSPIIETNGTGGGMKLFCGGVGPQYPDVENASRRMEPEELETCRANGVRDVTEIQVGLDGIAFAMNRKGPELSLTPRDVYKAIAANPFGKPNTARTWKDVNPAFPNVPIMVYGPATISGTRDALKELILVPGCETDPAMAALGDSDEAKHDAICTELRGDGAYADTSDNYNLIVQKLDGNPQAVGIFGYSYLESNADKLKGLAMNGVQPSYETIAGGTYPGSRPLFIYVKNAHMDAIPGLKQYVATWVKHWGPDGPLARQGLIAMPEEKRERYAKVAQNLTPVTADDLNSAN
jgi:phosphate transport system substrate-binding protein